MPRKPNSKKVTGKRIASIASRLLRSRRTSKATKSVAASALGQRPGRGKGRKR